jgi:hypothetical protein
MSQEAISHKVVVHTLDQQVIHGTTDQAEVTTPFRIRTREDETQNFELEDLKAVFFVKEFEGDPTHEEIHHLDRDRAPEVVWAQVQYQDGEILEGRIRNQLETLRSPGFYLWPTDDGSNNEKVYVVKSALTDFVILAPL